jgi:hypothetical protein
VSIAGAIKVFGVACTGNGLKTGRGREKVGDIKETNSQGDIRLP